MTTIKEKNEFVSYLIDLLQIIGSVSAKRMFGGHGIYLEGTMFALVDKNTLYFKADDEISSDFIEKGLEAFTYYKQGKSIAMSYYQAPEEIFENEEEMAIWANKSYAAALRAAKI